MKKILITGAAGFLGYNLSKKLTDECVIGVDNFQTGNNQMIDYCIDYYNADVRYDINYIIKNFKPEIIYNLACPASPPKYQMDPIGTFKTSVYGVMNILEAVVMHSPETIVFQASTSEVYGDPEIEPQREDYRGNVETTSIRSCYDEGKRAAETILTDFHRRYGTKIRIARIFNTYGPYMSADDGRVVSNFINQALRDKPITIYGDGSQTRSLCYVDDLLDGFVALADSDITTPVNLGNPNQETTVKELAEYIKLLTNSKSEIVYHSLPGDDPKKRCPDISKAIESLGWYPKVDMLDGIMRTIDYFNGIRK